MSQIALLQLCSGREVARNLETVAGLIGEAVDGGARLVVLPENFAMMGRESDRRNMAEREGEGPIQAFVAQTARSRGVWIVGGTIPLQQDRQDAPSASCLVFDDRGAQVARYDKIHLFDVEIPGGDEGYQESRHTHAGRKPVCLDTPLGRIGLAVCYDVRFPELSRTLVGMGMQILVVPAAFTATTGAAHWEVLLRARAVENLCYVAAAAQGGHHDNGRDTWGHSMLVDPWGRIEAVQAAGTGVIAGEIDIARLEDLRQRFPVLLHRRRDAWMRHDK